MITNKPPIYTASAAVYPYSEALYKRAQRQSRFGESYNLGLRWGKDLLWLPRMACPLGEDQRSFGEPVQFEDRFQPRNPEQGRVAKEARARLLAGRSFLLQAPTGWGKTVVGCSLIAAPSVRTVVITTKEDIVKQWVDAAKMVLGLREEQIGLWMGDQYPKPTHLLAVGLVQSIMKGPERYPDVDFTSFGLVVCDEVHRMGAEHFSQAMWWFPAKLRLGLSATPYRKDGREHVFHGHIGEVEVTAKQETLIPRVIVRRSPWRVPRVQRNGEIVKLPHEAGKLGHMSKLLARCRPRNELIAEFMQAAYKKYRSTVVFSDSLDHLDQLRTTAIQMGVPADAFGYYVGLNGKAYSGSKAERQLQREQAKAKPIVLATYQMASEATDVPWWDTCVLAVPRADVVQIVGRVRREYPGKTLPLVFDVVDDDSPVYGAFAAKRLRWYKSLGCEVRMRA